jgi:acetolactate synthase-1/2/3 large subunit
MEAYKSIISRIDSHGVSTVFTLMSEEIIELVSAVEAETDGDLDVVHARHEQGAAAMADGYARASDEVGVCIVGRGPAIAQTGTALNTARKKGSDVLYIVPTMAHGSTFDQKEFAQESYLSDMVGDVTTIHAAENIPSILDDAFRRVRIDGPVAVQIPMDLLFEEITDPEETGEERSGGEVYTREARVQPDERSLSEAVELYLDSDATKPPVILAGEGAVKSGAKESILALAEQTNALLATTIQSRGYFSDHPFSVGLVGTLGSNVANEYIADADYLLSIGASLNEHTTDSGRLINDQAKVVHIDNNAASINRYEPVDLGIQGDAQITSELLVAALQEEGIDRSGAFWTEQTKQRLSDGFPFGDIEESDRDGRIDPRILIEALDEQLPEDRLVVTDAGHFATWVVDGIDFGSVNDFIWTLDFTSIGLGLPMGVGAARAGSDRVCVAFCGDAGFMMSLQELETATRNDIPLIVVVMNDDSLGAEHRQAQKAGLSGEAARISAPDFEDVAASLGADGYTVRDRSDIAAIEDALADGSKKQLVVDCKIDKDVTHRLYS